MRRNLAFLSGLLILTLAAFWPVGRLGFIIYDDWNYVFHNPVVQSGLNSSSICWAFTSTTASNWHPLTWLSHMLDCQLFGLNPHEQHWVNLGFHATDTLLLFVLLQQLTGARWRSFLVAAFFACHPLHVESVAWIAERKDVLSAFFGLLTLLAYHHYCRRKTTRRYVVVVVLFAMGLMAKPMLVTLPVIMLLLDFWPLGRVPVVDGAPFLDRKQVQAWQPLLEEKIPLFLLGLVSCLVTLYAQQGALMPLQKMGWPERCLNSFLSYNLYLEKLLWPVNLAIYYPYTREELGFFPCTLSIVVLITLSTICIQRRQSQPWLLVGWAWFVVMLLPVIGIVQVGPQSMADRYAYLPSIGFFIAAAWGIAEIANRSKLWQAGVVCLGTTGLAACIIDTRYQLGFWKDNVTLFKHVVAVTPGHNRLGYYYLGNSYRDLGDLDGAAASYAGSVKADPGFTEGRNKLGYALLAQKKYDAAEFQLRENARLQPENARARVSVGVVLAAQHKYAEAQVEYLAAQMLAPDDPVVAAALSLNAKELNAQLMLAEPKSELKTNATPKLYIQMAMMESSLGDYSAAVQLYQKGLAGDPDSEEGLNNLAWLLATCSDETIRDGRRAVQLAKHACELTHYQTTVYIGTLAATYAEAGQFNDAIATAEKACASASAHGEKQLLESNQKLLALYQKHQPYHEPSITSPPAGTDFIF